MTSARAPGKVIVCGEHAVVHGKTAIAGAIGIYTEVQIRCEENAQEVLRLELQDVGISLEWTLDLMESLLQTAEPNPMLVTRCTEEVAVAFNDLVEEHQQWNLWSMKQQGKKKKDIQNALVTFLFLHTHILGLQPAVVTVKSEIPIGAGLGSSAAYSVALSTALLAFRHNTGVKPSSEGWNINRALVNAWAFEAEQILHGKASGIDNTVSTYGGIIKYQNGETMLVKSPSLTVLVTNTKVGRNTRELVDNVRSRLKTYPMVMSPIFEAVHGISETMCEILETMLTVDDADAFDKKLEDLIGINQLLLQSMGVSHDSIDLICSITTKHGLKSKLTGAGGGGSVLTFLPKNISSEKLQQTITELEENGFQCMKVELGCGGVEVHATQSP